MKKIFNSLMMVGVLYGVQVTSVSAVTVTINNYQGAWVATTTYAAGNIVTYNNQTFLSLLASNLNKTPGATASATYWQLLGSNVAGPVGPAGPVGATGPAGPAGAKGATGATGPAGPTGATGPAGATGAAGAAGAVGAAGKSVLNGAGVPATAIGTVGDFYLDTTAKKFYGPKTATGWGTGTSIVQGATGPAGATGATGPQGPVGLTGPAGATGATGTFQSGTSVGSMLYWGGTSWVEIAPPSGNGQNIQFCNGQPKWVSGICNNYNVGDTGPAGGVVIYMSPDKSLGIEVSRTHFNTPPGWSWGCQGNSVSGANGTAIGTGGPNTNAIAASCVDPNAVANLAKSYSQNGFNDWILPSKDELSIVRSNNNLICGAGCDPGNYYWSSTEYDSNNAWVEDFLTGNVFYLPKTEGVACCYYRLIRYIR